MISDIIVIYFIYVEEIWIFDSMIYSKTFFVLNMCERFKMIFLDLSLIVLSQTSKK